MNARRALLCQVAAAALSAAGMQGALAQIVRDGSIGQGPLTLTGPNYAIGASLGQQLGGNLFHSFSQFNVNTLESATFSGQSNVTNIISRVTGPSQSAINGTLRSTIAGANFWLINPHGIAFGPNASLDVSGSVHVSTADYLKLGSSGQFNATNPGASTLVSAPPSAFGFLGAPAPIDLSGTKLRLPQQAGLALAGGDIGMTGATLRAAGGKVDLLSVASAGEVDSAALSSTDVTAYGAVNMTHSLVSASNGRAPASGTIRIVAGRLMATGATIANDNTGATNGGQIALTLATDLDLSGADIFARSYGAGSAGGISITAANISLHDNAHILARTGGAAQGGNIGISLSGALAVVGEPGGASSSIYTDSVGPASTGASGSVTITARSVALGPNAGISALTSSAGRGGGLVLSSDTLAITEDGVIGAQTYGAGAAGNTTVSARLLSMSGAGDLLGGIFGDSNPGASGDAGIVKVTADALSLSGNSRVASDSYGRGRGGRIEVAARSLTLANGASIGSQAWGAGDGGTTFVDVSGPIAISSTNSSIAGIFGDSNTGARGDAGSVYVSAGSIDIGRKGAISSDTYGSGSAGDVTVRAGSVELRDSGNISSVVFGSGARGGNLDLTVDGRLSVAGKIYGQVTSGIFTYADTGTSGRAGNITIHAGDISLSRDGAILSSAYGAGDSGDISVSASGRIFAGAGGRSGIFAEAFSGASGNAGQITVSARSIMLARGGQISSSTSGPGSGGDVDIRAGGRLFIGERGPDGYVSGVFANTDDATGHAGSVRIRSGSIALQKGGQISSSTFSAGDGGDVRVAVRGSFAADGATFDSFPSGIFAVASPASTGHGGSVRLEADSVVLTGGAEVSSSTFATGNGGSVRVRTPGQLLVSGKMPAGFVSGIFATATATSIGDAGRISIQAGQLTLDDLGLISSSTSGPGHAGDIAMRVGSASMTGDAGVSTTSFGAGGGRAGNVSLLASGTVTLSGGDSGLFSRTEGVQPAGTIVLSAADILMGEGALISVRSSGTGNAGDVTLNAANSLRLLSGASITTGATFASGGNINIAATKLVYLRDSSITTSVAGGKGDGGNITIDPQFVVLDHSQIIANAFGGNGGNIRIVADNFLNQDSLVQASSQLGVSGNINIESPRVDVSGALRVLSTDFLDASRLMRESCASRAHRDSSTFIAGVRGGMPGRPESAARPVKPVSWLSQACPD